MSSFEPFLMSRGASLRAGREVLEEAVVLVGAMLEEGS